MSNKREALRIWRINKLKQIMMATRDKGKTVDMEKLIAFCCEDWGVNRVTARGYINVLTKGSFCRREKIEFAK